MSTNISYKGSTIASFSNDTKTLTTQGKYLEADVIVTDTSSAPSLQNKTVTPLTTSQSVTADSGYDGLGTVTVNAMPTGTEGTPVASKGIATNNSIQVTPTVTNSMGFIQGGVTKMGLPVFVSASELVSGTKTISGSGTTDVTNYANASVAAGSASGPNLVLCSDATITAADNNQIGLMGTASVQPTVHAGWVSSGTAETATVIVAAAVPTKSAATITPTTTDQTIASGTYLTGAQTIKGDANLVAGNIKKDVSIFGVMGTHEGGGGTDVSDTTATAADVATGKYFYTAAGVRTQGAMATYAGEYHTTGYSVSILLTNPSSPEAFYSCIIYSLNSTHLDEYGFYDDFTEIGSIDSPTGSATVMVPNAALAMLLVCDSSGMGMAYNNIQVTGDITSHGYAEPPYPDMGYLNLAFTVAGNGTITVNGINWDED